MTRSFLFKNTPESELFTGENLLILKVLFPAQERQGVYSYLSMAQLSHVQFGGYFLKMEI